VPGGSIDCVGAESVAEDDAEVGAAADAMGVIGGGAAGELWAGNPCGGFCGPGIWKVDACATHRLTRRAGLWDPREPLVGTRGVRGGPSVPHTYLSGRAELST
jgi:hypothetical protein